MKNKFSNIMIMLILLMLNSCAGIPRATVAVAASEILNPNIYQQSSPVVIFVYQLKSATTFQQTNFFALSNDAEKTLGADLLDKHELEIRPGGKQILHLPLSLGANYIGIVAEFRNPDTAQWRQVKAIKQGKNVKLQIQLSSQSIREIS